MGIANSGLGLDELLSEVIGALPVCRVLQEFVPRVAALGVSHVQHIWAVISPPCVTRWTTLSVSPQSACHGVRIKAAKTGNISTLSRGEDKVRQTLGSKTKHLLGSPDLEDSEPLQHTGWKAPQ
jgi:hypothetical protein